MEKKKKKKARVSRPRPRFHVQLASGTGSVMSSKRRSTTRGQSRANFEEG